MNTNNAGTQVPVATEIIQGTISLHKVSKTGNYNDLLNKPTLDFIPNSEKGVANGVAQLDNNSKLSSDNLPVATTTTLGAVKVGKNLAIDDDGTLSAVGGGSGGVVNEILIGGVIEYPSNKTIPDGWLECDGSAVSRTTYSELFAVIGTEFGSGDGSTTFNLPNMKGRVAVGLDASDSNFNTIGKIGGEKEHNHLSPLTWFAENGNKVGITNNYGYETVYDRDFYGVDVTTIEYSKEKEKLGYYTSTSSNLQPYFVTKFIIKAKESSAVIATVIDNLNSTSNTDALSANQGRLLNEKFGDYLPLAGGTMTGDINFSWNGLYWKEPGFGDQFKIVPQFSGSDDDNYLSIKGAVGDAGTQSELYDLMNITGKSGNVIIRGNAYVDGASGKGGKVVLNEQTGSAAETPNISSFNDIGSGQGLYRSGLYTVNDGTNWYNLINVRHRNGYDDGTNFGMQIKKGLTFNDTMTMRWQNNQNWSNWEYIPRWTVLYSNDSGTNGNITLSESAANFDVLEIFYKDNNGASNKSTRVYSPNGKWYDLSNVEPSEASTIIRRTEYGINGTTMWIRNNDRGYVNIQASGNFVNVDASYIYIYRVIGWR